MICYCLLRKPNRRCCVRNFRHAPSSLQFEIMMKACNCACAFVLVPLFFLYVYLVLLRWQMFPLYGFHFFFQIRKQFNPVLFFLQRQLLLQNKALSFNGDVPLLSSSSLNVHTYICRCILKVFLSVLLSVLSLLSYWQLPGTARHFLFWTKDSSPI